MPAIEPYWQDEARGLTLYHGDCRDILPHFADGEFGMLHTDPPFEVTITSFSTRTPAFAALAQSGWAFNHGWLPEAARCLVEGAGCYVWMNDEGWSSLRADGIACGLRPCQRLIWVKTNPRPSLPRKNYRSGTELCMYLTRGEKTSYFEAESQRDCLPVFHAPIVNGKERVGHPSQKPESIVRGFLRRSAPANLAVLDPFCGSGTTLAACAKLGLPCTGIELEEKYCHMAASRLSKDLTYGEPNLFSEVVGGSCARDETD